jgi:hypothetical protein
LVHVSFLEFVSRSFDTIYMMARFKKYVNVKSNFEQNFRNLSFNEL